MKKITLIIILLFLTSKLLSQTKNIPHSANSTIPLNNEGNIQWSLGKNYCKFIVNPTVETQNSKKILSQNEVAFSQIKVYPNPFKTELFIKLNDSFSNISIYTISGQLIVSKKINNDERNIYLSLNNINILSGFYLMKLTNKTTTKRVKIIKQ